MSRAGSRQIRAGLIIRLIVNLYYKRVDNQLLFCYFGLWTEDIVPAVITQERDPNSGYGGKSGGQVFVRGDGRSREKTVEHKSRMQKMAMCSLFTALTAVGAFIKIPIPVVPFTLQVLFILLAGLILGGKLGAASVGAYALLGLAGLPVFAEGGGFWYVLKPSFGYIPGFILASFLVGKMAERMEKRSFGKILAVNFAGLGIVYGIGMAYYYVICNYVIGTPIAVGALFFYCFLMVVPGDICLCFLAAWLAERMRPVLMRM